MIAACCLLLLQVCTASLDRLEATRVNQEQPERRASQCMVCPLAYPTTSQPHQHHHGDNWNLCIHISYSMDPCDFDVPKCVPYLGETYPIFGSTYLRVEYKHSREMWALSDSLRCENNCCNLSPNQLPAATYSLSPTTTPVVTSTAPATLKVRLVDGPNASEGRVEVFYDGRWGTVCDDNWDDDDASVVCRMLGYSGAQAVHTSKARYGSGHGPIWLDETQCSGQETNLGQCSMEPYGHGDCDHSEDAGVICQALPTTTMTTTTAVPREILKVRLVDGPSASEGRVEVLHNGVWGTVCDDNWDDDDAKVTCRMLGYSTVQATHTSKARYGSGQGPIWLDETQCSGQETNLGQCHFVPYGHGDCDHSEDAGVICQAITSSTTKPSTTTPSSTTVPLTTTTPLSTTSTPSTTSTATTLSSSSTTTTTTTSKKTTTGHWFVFGGGSVIG
ncbi:soluble scavenger receptor cysteine-rich domain-containing protein SSC5D-like [Pecten maximus]|uniref:soluble scavenger receptor cysteine-rich domain-containing protein SSC5D-like n=1 Tax=Pecten maximus TaxID=6579 RepID=UPI001458DAEA|nr:soluble scavenger receptor cysteine-rich domain-containing protein SSC5D-like [Pecten maximus]